MYDSKEELDRMRGKLQAADAAFWMAALEWSIAVPRSL